MSESTDIKAMTEKASEQAKNIWRNSRVLTSTFNPLKTILD